MIIEMAHLKGGDAAGFSPGTMYISVELQLMFLLVNCKSAKRPFIIFKISNIVAKYL